MADGWSTPTAERAAVEGYLADRGRPLSDLAAQPGRSLSILAALNPFGPEEDYRVWPAQAVRSLADAAMLPGDVYAGRVDPGSAEAARRAVDLAGLAGLGSFARLPSMAETRIARSIEHGYDPPDWPQRPFEADYPQGAIADEAGRLLEDVDGRPIRGRWVVGRRLVGEPDEAFPPAELDALAEAATGTAPAPVARGALPREASAVYRRIEFPNRVDREIAFDRGLAGGDAARAISHELGHAIDDLAAEGIGGFRIPVEGAEDQFRRIYADLASEQGSSGPRFGPEDFGYRGKDVRDELAVEALRAYLQNPNYIKSAAPEAAYRIRSAVNDHPTLSRIIQFNASGVPTFAADRPDE